MTARAAAAALLLAAASAASAQVNVLGVETLQGGAPLANRINLAVLGDGYTASAEDQAKLAADARALVDAFFAQAPYSELRPITNVKLVHVVSNETGADYGSYGTTRDTALGATFNCSGIDRLLCVDTGLALQVLAAHVPEYTYAVVIVNDPKYGGGGGGIAAVSTNLAAQQVFTHEMGHTIGHLADEYVDPQIGGGPCPLPGDCSEPNATSQLDRSLLKWKLWVADSTPVPTPAGALGVGLFEGNRYVSQGVYRPWYSGCMMQALSYAFDDVCAEGLVVYGLGNVHLVDATSPAQGPLAGTTCSSGTFSVTALPLARWVLRYAWSVGGQDRPETGPTLTIRPGELAPGPHVVLATVRYETPTVRRDFLSSLSGSARWTLDVAADSCGAVDAGAADAGAVDAGAADGGVADGGVADGGVADGGGADAGVDGGAADAGPADGGAADGGADAGLDGGAADGGAADAGAVDGGALDGGAADAGVADGGTSGGDADAGSGQGGGTAVDAGPGAGAGGAASSSRSGGGCASGGGGAPWSLALLAAALAWARRRRTGGGPPPTGAAPRAGP